MDNSDDLRAKAAHYRQLALHVTDKRVLDALTTLADEYDELAAELEHQALDADHDANPDTSRDQ